MSNRGDQQQQHQEQSYWASNTNFQQIGDFNFEIPAEQQDFGQQELNFETYAADQSYASAGGQYGSNPYLNPDDGSAGFEAASGGFDDEFADEPPLLEELGINPDFIVQKTLTVLNPLRTPAAAAVQDTDFAGPLVFCLTFGAFLLLSGKVHFNYIYGIGVMGSLGIWALLSLMSGSNVAFSHVVTVLGYCLLPMVVLSGVNVVLNLQGYVGIVLTSFAILWCSLSASKLFVTAHSMSHQQPLIMYPCALVYGVFALITVF